MLTLQTIGSVDNKHKLPAPKQYVAISVLWAILFMLADTGLGKLAARLSLLILLTASMLGPFGKRLVDFLNLVSKNFAIRPGQAGGFTTSGATMGPQPDSPSVIPGTGNA
jgi:hypothetical protein